MFQKKAKANKIIAGELFGEKHPKQEVPQISAKPLEPIETRQELARIAKVSHDTIAKVKVIEQKAAPEVKKELETGTKSINEVYKEIKKEEKEEARKEDIAHLMWNLL